MIEIYGTKNCGFCKKAVDLAEAYNLMYHYIDAEVNKEEFRDKFPDAKTVPQIIWNGNYVGGYTELVSEIENTIGGYGDGKI